MAVPIFFRIHVPHQPGIGLDADCVELCDEIAHAQMAFAQGQFDLNQRISMVQRAKRFQSTGALSGNATMRRNGGLHKTEYDARLDPGVGEARSRLA